MESPLQGMRHAAQRIDFPLRLFLPQADGSQHAPEHHHAHQVPQMTRPKREPVTGLGARNASPTSVPATATASYLKFLVIKNITDPISATNEHIIAVMAIGT